MSQDLDFEEYKTPGQAAKIIGVSVPTLRKYSLLIENATKATYFERNQQNMRLYRETDIKQLKQLIKLSKHPDLTLKDAVNQLYAISSTDKPGKAAEKAAVITKKTEQTEAAPIAQFVHMMQSMQETITTQKASIEALQKQLETIQAQNAEILKQLPVGQDAYDYETPLASSYKQHDPQKVKIDNSNTSVSNQTAGNSEWQADPLQAAEKADEAIEQQPKQPRTLADMQLPAEKKRHWWQRLLN
ncbi:MerR family transcriptional regulator [Lactobacillus sp. CC-MHH1034]|uniref:MerR family transcriptional regulator n=1 Tax=Agrilactobacillus fermenti TaxID=2586909 RepID=UPI001E2DF4F2|nr:MerR family transcriptional regulator [Agrilactobacillus fermenti]MCD2255555.1 MerR family transcriptional regulator [Agrilactobacillus fermenti]